MNLMNNPQARNAPAVNPNVSSFTANALLMARFVDLIADARIAAIKRIAKT